MKTLIIALAAGLFITLTSYNSSMNAVDKTTQKLDVTQAQMINSSLKQYSGTHIKGTTVNELIGYVEVINTNEIMPNNVTIVMLGEVKDSEYYVVEMLDEDDDYYYDTITIIQN